MATYVTLFKYTQQGLQNAKNVKERLAQNRSAMEGAGAKLTHFWWTQGEYDAIAVSEWPDEETAMAFLIQLGGQGNFQTQTLGAFDEAAIDRIVAKLP
jgi:uncharacterized protein with GYD domain